MFKNSRTRHNAIAAAVLLLGAQSPVIAAADYTKEKPLVVRHSDHINLAVLKDQLQDAADIVFIESDIGGDDRDLPLGDVIDLDARAASQACDRGQLYLLPVSHLPAALDLSTIREDYLPNSLLPCAVGHTISSSIIISDVADDLPAPSILGDFFDLAAYPGRRALQMTVRSVAERALLANGVAAEQLYETLAEPATAWPIIENALNSLQDQISWVKNDQMAIDAIESGRASFAIVSGQSAVRQTARVGSNRWQILWDQALYQIRSWAIPAHSDRPDDAWRLIQRLATPQINGRYAAAAGNAPARQSAISLVSRTFQRQLPSHPDNAGSLVWQDEQWWQRHASDYESRFQNWLAKRESSNTLAPAPAITPMAQWPTTLPVISRHASAP